MADTDLFVVCKSCGEEVSPYITECPYCGNRLRKRAPKIDREGRPVDKRTRRSTRGSVTPRLARLRPNEIPGVRVDGRPYGTLALLGASAALELATRAGALDFSNLLVFEGLGSQWWRVFTAPFVYSAVGFQLVCFIAIAIFGWLLERRLGPVPVILAFLACGAGGMALAVGLESDAVALGGNGAALGLLALWAVPDIVRRRAGDETDSDLLGTGVIAAVVLCMPLATSLADGIAGVGGLAIGSVLGLGLYRSGR
jgi:membrane associated rhomboid family serine protease